MSRESAVRIALLLPDVLGTYSDRGNGIVLAQRLRWRGITAEMLEVPTDRSPPSDCDLFVLGGGEDAAQAYAARWLIDHPRLLDALQTRQVLAVCAGLQILGHWMAGPDGRRVAGTGILDLTTSPGRRRAVGEVVADCIEPGVERLTGFENHRGRTSLGPAVRPLGRVTRGVGNGDGTDGVLTDTVVGTYLHGPVLARNPDLADLLLRRATGLALSVLTVPAQEEGRRLHLSPRTAGRRRGRRARWPGASDRRRFSTSTGGSRRWAPWSRG